MARFTRILSIDGGGIRGILPGQVLAALESVLQRKTGDADARLADFFDLIAGTSTGGILTCLYLCPDDLAKPLAKRRPRFTAAQAVELYLDQGDEIFDIPVGHRVRTLGGLRDEKYPVDNLEQAIAAYLEDRKLSDLLKPCLITAYDIRRRKGHFFTQHDARDFGPQADYYLRDVARATSAAPTYFEVPKVQSLLGVSYPLVDGGVFANNPALCAYAEARTFDHAPTAKDMLILSLGTGFAKRRYFHEQAKDWGLAGWAKPLIDIMMSGVAETVDFQLRQIFDTLPKANRRQYSRIDTELVGPGPDMDDASSENLLALRELGLELASRHRGEIERVADLLLAE